MYKWDYLIWKKRKLENQERFEYANKIFILEEDKRVILAAKIITYPGEPEQRFTFISPEAHDALQDYMKFREKDGEKITDDSVIIRDEWQTMDVVKRGANRSMASNPKGIKAGSIQRYLAREEKKEGFHQDLPPGVRRYAVKTAHGFRRFFETNAKRAGMDQTYIDYLMEHSLGISEHYLDLDEFAILDHYVKIVEDLTIIKDSKIATQFQKQVAELTERNEQENYAIMGKLAEKEKEIEEIKTRQKIKEDELTSVRAAFEKMVDKIELGQEKQERLVAELEESKNRKDQEVDRLKGILAEVQEMREYVLDHLDDKHRDELFTRIQKLSAKERKRLEERKKENAR